MFKVVVGHSDDPDSLSAAEEVIAQCQTDLAGVLPIAGLLFAAIEFDHALILQQIHAAFPNIELIGCTSDGEVSSRRQFQRDSIVLTLFCSDEIEIRAGIGRDLSNNAIAAVEQAVAQATCTTPARLCITVPDSLTINGAKTLSSLQTVLGETFPIFGGMAADDYQFTGTYQFYQTEVLQDAIPVLMFAGASLKFSYGVASGWQPIGMTGQVTEVQGDLLYEIDQKPALTFYRECMNGADPLPELPFAVFESQTSPFYLRGFAEVDTETGIIHTLADVPDQAFVQVSSASRDEILAASKTSVLQAFQTYPGEAPAAAIVFTCDCRHKILGTRVREEYELLQSVLPDGVPCGGFYTYGELSPFVNHHKTQLHNHTIVTLLLGTR